MPAETLQFVHAANLFLDQPLRIPHAVPPDAREIVEDATLLAFTNLTKFCCDYGVDFLLLTGNTFVESERSLAARVVLLRELQKLDDAGISTFVLPGDEDPLSAWRAIPGLPDSVTVLDPYDPDPIAIEDNGRVLATVETTTGRNQEPHIADGRCRIGLRIGTQEWLTWQPESLHHNANSATPSKQNLAANRDDIPGGPFDYLALGGDCRRTTLRTETGLIHHPGEPQGNSPDDIGFGGATLLEWSEAGTLQYDAVPTAVVRFERMSTGIARLGNAAELQQTMLEQLAQHPPTDSERVRFITWRLTGSGPLLPLLHNTNALQELAEEVARRVATAKSLRPVIHFALSDLQPLDPTTPSETDSSLADSSLVAEFRRELQKQTTLTSDGFASRFEKLSGGGHEPAARLAGLVGQTDRRTVLQLAERRGAERLHRAAAKGTHA